MRIEKTAALIAVVHEALKKMRHAIRLIRILCDLITSPVPETEKNKNTDFYTTIAVEGYTKEWQLAHETFSSYARLKVSACGFEVL